MSNRDFHPQTWQFIRLARSDDLAGAEAWLRAHPEIVTDRDSLGETPLHWLAIESELDAVKLLIAHGADVQTTTDAGTPILSDVVTVCSVPVLQALLEAGADPEVQREDPLGYCLLLNAAKRQKDARVLLDALLAAGADLEARDAQGQTPFFSAADCRFCDAIRLLAAYGADVHARDEAGDTPLHAIIDHALVFPDALEVIQTLLDVGADSNQRDASGQTTLHTAAARAADPRIIDALIAAGADVDARDTLGRTPLHCAAEEGNIAAALALREHGAALHARDKSGVDFIANVPPEQRAAWREAFAN